MTLTRGEAAYLVFCVVVIIVGGLVWAWAANYRPAPAPVPRLPLIHSDVWPTVYRSGVVVMPEDLDRP